MPVSAVVSKPSFETVIVYVSGPSESSAKRPDASVITVALCEGLTATTRAPAIGSFLVLTTCPVSEPVVPASEGSGLAAKAPASKRNSVERPNECSIRGRSRAFGFCHSTGSTAVLRFAQDKLAQGTKAESHERHGRLPRRQGSARHRAFVPGMAAG